MQDAWLSVGRAKADSDSGLHVLRHAVELACHGWHITVQLPVWGSGIAVVSAMAVVMAAVVDRCSGKQPSVGHCIAALDHQQTASFLVRCRRVISRATQPVL